MKNRRCSWRFDKHLPHPWRGSKIWDETMRRWTKPTYQCDGHELVVEGGAR